MDITSRDDISTRAAVACGPSSVTCTIWPTQKGHRRIEARTYEEEQLACIAEYTGLTEDGLDSIIDEVDAEFGPEKRADKAQEVLTRIVAEERAT